MEDQIKLTARQCYDKNMSVNTMMAHTGFSYQTCMRWRSTFRIADAIDRTVSNIERVATATKMENDLMQFIEENKHDRSAEMDSLIKYKANQFALYCA